MKLNKTMLLAALAGGLLAGGSALAQDSSTNTPAAPPANNAPRMRGQQSFDSIATTLALTDDQKAKVKPIIDSMHTQISAVVQDSSLSRDDRRTKIKAIRDDINAQLKAILTPDQYQKWTTMNARVRRMSPPGGAPAPGAPATPPAAPAPPTQ